jgi:hypothetical protein
MVITGKEKSKDDWRQGTKIKIIAKKGRHELQITKQNTAEE